MTRLLVALLAVLVSCGCTVALYAPWHRPPEVTQARYHAVAVQPTPTPRPTAEDVRLASSLMGGSVTPENLARVFAALRGVGLDDQQAVAAINAAKEIR